MMNCFTLATGTPSPPGSGSGSSRPAAGPISPPRRRASPSALSARPRPWRSNVPWPWSPRDVESSWPRTRAPRPCGSRRGTCRRGRPCATPRSRATGAGGREAAASSALAPCDRANRVRICYGADDLETLKMRWRWAGVLQNEEDHAGTLAILEDVVKRCRRVLGNSNPLTERAQLALSRARERERLSNS